MEVSVGGGSSSCFLGDGSWKEFLFEMAVCGGSFCSQWQSGLFYLRWWFVAEFLFEVSVHGGSF
jgi:hypothetical protein